MSYVLLLSVLLVALSILLLGIRIFFVKDGSFPNTHVGGNEELRKRGIDCMYSQDLQEQNKKSIFDLPSEHE